MSSSSNSTTIENQEQQYGPFGPMATNMTDPVNQTQKQRQKGWGWQCFGWIPGEPRDQNAEAAARARRQRVVITTAGYRDYNMQWFVADNKNLKKLMRAIQNVHGDGEKKCMQM